MPEFDIQGYQLVPQEFNKGGYSYKFVHQIDDDWRIYSAYSPFSKKIIGYELVRFVRSEEYKIAGSTVPKKWSYPTANAFGKHGFSCNSIERCKIKYKEILEREKIVPEVVFNLPFDEEFTVLELSKKLSLPYSKIYAKVKEMGDKVKVVRSLKNKVGRDTKVYIVT